MKRIILFQFHKEWAVCRNRLQLLRNFNPGLHIYGLFGGEENDYDIVCAQFSCWCEDIYLLRGKSPRWKWQNTDLAVRSWFKDVGCSLSFDVVNVVQWDLLMFDSMEVLYRNIPPRALGLTGLTKVDQIADRWHWTLTEPPKSERLKLIEWAQTHYSYRGDSLTCLGPGYCLPREFLGHYSAFDVPELCHDELRLPLFARILGFDLCDTGFYPKWYDEEEEKFFNANGGDLDTKVIKDELARSGGRKVFHPYRGVFPLEEAQELLARRR